MIRHPLHSAVGRARPDISRVTDGIAASLRQFSVSARRSAQDNDDEPQRPSSRQRAVAAANELIKTVDSGISASRPSLNGEITPAPARAQGPNIITLRNVSRGGFAGIQRVTAPNGGPPPRFGPLGGRGGPNIIRGGFRGRGGSAGGPLRSGPQRGAGARAGAGRRGRDDRPQRRPRRDDDGEEGGKGRGKRGQQQDTEEPAGDLMNIPAVKEYVEGKETGKTMPFNPTLSLASLAGWGPSMATSSSPFGQGETVLRQARILGGGEAYHPENLQDPLVLFESWRDRNGAFVPPSAEAQIWKKQILKDRPFEAPAEVKTAVLEDALLGKYGEGPKYADAEDTIGTLRSYIRRDGTWNAQAERGIEAKVRSLLGSPVKAPVAKAGGADAAKTEAKV
ncbi:hypothetical protein F5Y11DRAFT_296637 [Daldinia sp. FL1419]|nr:hypothetical protein F5Y11DRAFT_296637 [Daldinia sp. FL1419]